MKRLTTIFIFFSFFLLTSIDVSSARDKIVDAPSTIGLFNRSTVPLVGFGIVNPFGPTLMGFATAKLDSGTSALFWFSLNPFSQNSKIIAQYSFDNEVPTTKILFENYGADKKIIEFLQKKYEGSYGTPTFLLLPHFPGSPAEGLQYKKIIYEIILNSKDPKPTLDRLKKFPLNVWDRVQDEIQDLGKILKHGRENELKEEITGSDLSELIRIIRNKKHISQEMGGFMYAWEGAINFQRTKGTGLLAKNALSTREFAGILFTLFPNLVKLMKNQKK